MAGQRPQALLPLQRLPLTPLQMGTPRMGLPASHLQPPAAHRHWVLLQRVPVGAHALVFSPAAITHGLLQGRWLELMARCSIKHAATHANIDSCSPANAQQADLLWLECVDRFLCLCFWAASTQAPEARAAHSASNVA